MGRRGQGRRPREVKPRTVQFWEAPEVRELASLLIEQNHQHLQGQKLVYVFCAKNPVGGRGCKAHGGVTVIGGMQAALAQGLAAKQVPVEHEERFFLVKISRPYWNNLSESERLAKLDHYLAHCGLSDKGNPTIWPHDVEEFQAIINRHGLWQANLQDFGRSVKAALDQLPLDLDGKGTNGANGQGKAGDLADAGATPVGVAA